MSAILNLTTTEYNLSAVLDNQMSAVTRLIEELETSGIQIITWNLASCDQPNALRLTMRLSGDPEIVNRALLHCKELQDCEFCEVSDAIHLELALVSVVASGTIQDEAASLIASRGGRLLGLGPDGFTAQISEKPEAIETTIALLQAIAPTEATRSGQVFVRRS